MKLPFCDRLEDARLTEPGRYHSWRGDPFGAFRLQGPCGAALVIMANDAWEGSHGWEHVSVSNRHRTPNWQEMCFVKDLFWNDEDWVVQFHPARSQYVNLHPYTLHLWRKPGTEFPTPPPELVGPQKTEVPA